MVSTGIIPVNTSEAKIREMLSVKASDRGLECDFEQLQIDIPRPGMKVAVCPTIKK